VEHCINDVSETDAFDEFYFNNIQSVCIFLYKFDNEPTKNDGLKKLIIAFESKSDAINGRDYDNFVVIAENSDQKSKNSSGIGGWFVLRLYVAIRSRCKMRQIIQKPM
jgi:hypothetical protein